MVLQTPAQPPGFSAMSRRIRLAVLLSTMPTGGAERVTCSVLTHLDHERFESEVYFLKAPGTVGRQLMEHGVRGYSRLWKHRFDPLVVVRLSRRLRAFSPDILLTLSCHRNAMFWGGVCSLVVDPGTRVTAVHHTDTVDSKRDFNRIDRLFLSSAASIIALSKSHAQYLERAVGLEPQKITIIENGIVPELYEHTDPDKIRTLRNALRLREENKVVIMVAGLRPEKSHESLLRAASILVPSRSLIRFLIVGDGPKRGELEQLSDELHVQQNVTFLGERDDICDLLHIADVLVLPSQEETLPLTIMEAMAAGVPVIASRVGSIPDMIEDGVNGRLISPANGEELAVAVTELLDNSSLAEAIANAARRTVHERYSLERMILKYSAFLEHLAGRR